MNKKILNLKSLSDLGSDNLSTKLNKYLDNELIQEIYIKDIDIFINRQNIELVSKIISYYTTNKYKTLGRPKITYPLNWDENYVKYKNKFINSSEFMNLVKLKKTTFYKLLHEYEKGLK